MSDEDVPGKRRGKPANLREYYRWLLLEGMRRAKEGRRYDATKPTEWRRGFLMWHRAQAAKRQPVEKPTRFPRLVDLRPIKGTDIDPCRFPIRKLKTYRYAGGDHATHAGAPQANVETGRDQGTVAARRDAGQGRVRPARSYSYRPRHPDDGQGRHPAEPSARGKSRESTS